MYIRTYIYINDAGEIHSLRLAGSPGLDLTNELKQRIG